MVLIVVCLRLFSRVHDVLRRGRLIPRETRDTMRPECFPLLSPRASIVSRRKILMLKLNAAAIRAATRLEPEEQ